jgi:phosphoribosylformylglycinamidine synthase
MIGMVGLLKDVACRVPAAFQGAGDAVICLGATRGALGGSQYLSLVTGDVFGAPPAVDLAAERALVECLAECAEARLLASAHDVSEGGLAVALAECAALSPVMHGCDVDLGGDGDAAPAAMLFGEDHARAVVSARQTDVAAVLERARLHGVPARVAGTVGAPSGAVRIAAGGRRVDLPAPRLRQVYENALSRRLEGARGTQLARGV